MINYWILGSNILGQTCFWRRPAVKLSIPLFLSPSHGIKMAWSCSLSVSQQNIFRAKMNKTMHIMHVSICYSGWMNNGKFTSWHPMGPMSVKCDELMGILGDWRRLQVLGLSRSFPFPVGRPFGLVTWWPIEHQRVLNWGLGEICSQLGFLCHWWQKDRQRERERERVSHFVVALQVWIDLHWYCFAFVWMRLVCLANYRRALQCACRWRSSSLQPLLAKAGQQTCPKPGGDVTTSSFWFQVHHEPKLRVVIKDMCQKLRRCPECWWAFSYQYRFYPRTDGLSTFFLCGRAQYSESGVAGSLPQVAVGWPFGWSDQDCKLDRHGAAISHWDLGSPAPGLKCQSLSVLPPAFGDLVWWKRWNTFKSW